MKKKRDTRPFIQAAAAILTNSYLAGFLKGKIYTGNLKLACVPGLNCYSCPGAVGACPIGAMQAVLGGRKHNFSFYVLGILMLFGMLLGRFICGFLCPFGFVQDLLHKIRTPKVRVPERLDKPMRLTKYVVFLVAVVVLPIFATNAFGMADPYYCKWICPAGTLEGGIPLLLLNEGLRKGIGFLFQWKVAILAAVVVSAVFIYRPFCKYLCPLGAFYSLFNRISLYQMTVDKDKCTGCKACERACGMNVHVTKNINSTECIRCGKCARVCAAGAIQTRFGFSAARKPEPGVSEAETTKP